MSKNIVVLADGTGQEGGIGNNSNVYKLFNVIEDRTPEQVVYYDPGLGTRADTFLGKAVGLATGYGISKNIRDCYEFIFKNYESGDDIYLIGFSRGATTVRSLSAFIHHFGILPESRPELIRRAYKIYRNHEGNGLPEKASAFVEKHHTMWTTVKFIGCFDTVAALGVPFEEASAMLDQIPYFQHTFHDLKLSESVENACQALAVDEERKTFLPKIWNSEIKKYQTMKQVWFPGVHTDIGGGYPEQQLSDIALKWMWRQARDFGLRLYDPTRIEFNPEATGVMHASSEEGWNELYREKSRQHTENISDTPVVHESVLQRAERLDGYEPWILEQEHEIEPSGEVGSNWYQASA